MKHLSRYLMLLAMCSVFLVSEASAQMLLAEKQALTLDAAKVVAAAAEAEALSNDWQVVIVVVDAGGHLLYLQRMDGVQLGSLKVAQEKAVTAALYRRSTKAFADRIANGNNATLSLPNVIAIEGGLPIIVNEQVIGAIGVSGVPAHFDAQIGRAGIAALHAQIGQ